MVSPHKIVCRHKRFEVEVHILTCTLLLLLYMTMLICQSSEQRAQLTVHAPSGDFCLNLDKIPVTALHCRKASNDK